MPTPLELLFDPITVTMPAMFTALALAGLPLAGTLRRFGHSPEVLAFERVHIAPLIDPVPEAFAGHFQQGSLAQPIDALLLDRFVLESPQVPAHVWRAAFAGFVGDGFSARPGQIDVPTLVVRRRHDAICPAAEQQQLRLIDTARLGEYADAGHVMHWEGLQRFAPDLSRFANSVAAPAPIA